MEQSMYKQFQRGRVSLAIAAGVAGIAIMTTLSSGAGARDGVSPTVTEKLSVDSHSGKVLVKITVDNQSDHIVYVPRALMSATEPEGRMFDVRDSSNSDPLDYIGMMVKRPPPGKNDYIAVKPHSKLSNTLDITQSYRFQSGRHAYQINLAGTYLNDLSNLDQETPIEPASAMFAHVGQ
jgi:hypothetical protein